MSTFGQTKFVSNVMKSMILQLRITVSDQLQFINFSFRMKCTNTKRIRRLEAKSEEDY